MARSDASAWPSRCKSAADAKRLGSPPIRCSERAIGHQGAAHPLAERAEDGEGRSRALHGPPLIWLVDGGWRREGGSKMFELPHVVRAVRQMVMAKGVGLEFMGSGQLVLAAPGSAEPAQKKSSSGPAQTERAARSPSRTRWRRTACQWVSCVQQQAALTASWLDVAGQGVGAAEREERQPAPRAARMQEMQHRR